MLSQKVQKYIKDHSFCYYEFIVCMDNILWKGSQMRMKSCFLFWGSYVQAGN